MGSVTKLPEQETPDSPDYVETTAGQIGFAVEGKAPTSQTLRLYGGKIELTSDDIELRKGGWVEVRVIGVLRRVNFVDSEDEKTDQVTACDKQWGLKIKRLDIVGPVEDPNGQFDQAA